MDNNEMRRMQQEAINRVNEMQARAKQKLQGSGDVRGEASPEPPMPPPRPEPNDVPLSAPEAVPLAQEGNLQGLFDALMEDHERTMILVLILLLFTEQADTSVIFALLYTVL